MALAASAMTSRAADEYVDDARQEANAPQIGRRQLDGGSHGPVRSLCTRAVSAIDAQTAFPAIVARLCGVLGRVHADRCRLQLCNEI